MIWYKYLYLGETAKKHRFSILQKLRLGKVQPGVHVITPASGGHNLLDILPAYVLRQNYYREQADLLIVGVGASYQDAVETVGRIVDETYRETGGCEDVSEREGRQAEEKEVSILQPLMKFFWTENVF